MDTTTTIQPDPFLMEVMETVLARLPEATQSGRRIEPVGEDFACASQMNNAAIVAYFHCGDRRYRIQITEAERVRPSHLATGA